MRLPGGVRCQNCSGCSSHPAASPAAHPEPGRPRGLVPGRGGGVSARRLERGTRAVRGSLASSGASAERGCGPGPAAVQSTAGLPLLRRLLQTLRPAPEPRRRRRQRREGGEAPLAQMRSSQSLEGNRLQTRGWG